MPTSIVLWTSSHERIKSAVKILRDGRISIIDFMLTILDPSELDFAYNRDWIYNRSRQEKESVIGQDKKGNLRRCLTAYLQTRVVELGYWTGSVPTQSPMCPILSSFYQRGTLNSTMQNVVVPKAPVLHHILRCAAQSYNAREKNKIKDCSTACNVIITPLASQRSHHSTFLTAPFTLFLRTNGASRQTIEALYKCGLCISFTSLLTLLEKLAVHCIEHARLLVCQPHVMCYDNINISTSIFVEQRSDAPAKVQSGTFAILYEVRNGNPEHMRLSPMLNRALDATEISFATDVRPTRDQMGSFRSQLRIHVIEILLANCSNFVDYNRSMLCHGECHKMPQGYRTKQFPLWTLTIDESSITGNTAVIHDVYINQLQMQHHELSDRAIPSFNDQSTDARIRGAKTLWVKDVNPFTRLQVIKLGFGLFHLCLNLVWALLHVHRGSIHQVGSLSYFFALLDRTRLGCEHPDYHTLLATLMQILRGIIMNAWRKECGHISLAAFASSGPTANNLLEIADKILVTHATPIHEPSKKKQTNKTLFEMDSEPMDTAHCNLQLLTCDLLYVLELTSAISHGDWGHIEDILGTLAMIFRGAGSNNYCSEILHFIFNLKKIWTPEFANIMRDNALVNLTGLEGHCMPIDLNIEHLIKFLKACLAVYLNSLSLIDELRCYTVKLFFSAKGIYSTWDHLGDISATVSLLQNIKKQVRRALSIAYHGLNHTTPNMTPSIWRVANKVHELGLHMFNQDREENDSVKPVIDVLAEGEQKLKSSTLSTFNRKVREMLAGKGYEQEEDKLLSAAFDLTSTTTEDIIHE
ncbi:hypothetical protein DFH29DRAFT_1083321 [Suillus ampliporus]|nr:hypothetical protein DFH29DRAFT_1083321 [Suillus ampliporus]